MPAPLKRATIYLDPDLHRALRLKAVETDRTISDLVNEAVQLEPSEDAGELEVYGPPATEPELPFEDLVRDLKRRGKL